MKRVLVLAMATLLILLDQTCQSKAINTDVMERKNGTVSAAEAFMEMEELVFWEGSDQVIRRMVAASVRRRPLNTAAVFDSCKNAPPKYCLPGKNRPTDSYKSRCGQFSKDPGCN